MERLDVYIPIDRRIALARGEALPDRTTGAVLFVDVSGFTPLTEALAQELGPQCGAEVLTQYLNQMYAVLIDAIDRFGGSVIGFSGDAISCWFGQDHGLRAAACALVIQQATPQMATFRTPGGSTFRLTIKATIAAGSARRFVVGRLDVQLFDVLAGAIMDRVTAAEHLTNPGEVVASVEAVAPFPGRVTVREWRSASSSSRFAVIADLKRPVAPAPWPADAQINDKAARAWLMPRVYERLQSGQEPFLADLRPVVALFLKFGGIDYDGDDTAGEKLGHYIRWVQSIVARYDGALLQLTMGDKGSYLYAAFGAPIAHENDSVRAVAAALELRALPPELGFIREVQIGISRGQMRTGNSGGTTRRTYSVLGNEVNVAARLMTRAQPNQILTTQRIFDATRAIFDFEELPALALKGLAHPLQVFAARSRRLVQTSQVFERRSQSAIMGRNTERFHLNEQLLSLLIHQSSRVVVITGEAGIGKSRLVADLLEETRMKRSSNQAPITHGVQYSVNC